MTVRPPRPLLATLAALLLSVAAAPLASLAQAPASPDARAAQLRQGLQDDLEDGDAAASCESRAEPAASSARGKKQDRMKYCTGELIVALQPGIGVDELEQVLDGDVRLTLLAEIPSERIALVAVSANRERDIVARLDRERNYVRWAELNYVGNSPQANPSRFFPRDAGAPEPADSGTSWGRDRIGAAPSQICVDGRGVAVAVIDTGIDVAHPAFAGSLLQGWNAYDESTDVADAGNGQNDDGDSAGGEELIDESVGHGTHVAGIVLQAAPGAAIMPIKALDSDGDGQAFYLARAIHHAREAGVDVINLSLGSTGNSRAVSDAVRQAIAAGIVVVSAAGNTGKTGAAEYPAAIPGVVAVGATDELDNPASASRDEKFGFSTVASGIDLAAPGMHIASAFPVGAQGIATGYATWSGTSMAAPWVSASAALVMQAHPDWNASRVVDELRSDADPMESAPRRFGSGRVDAAVAACGS